MNGYNVESNKHKTEELLEFFYDRDRNLHGLTDSQRKAAVELYKALIDLKPSDAGNVTDIITKEDIKNATIRVNGKTETGDKYKTDLSFTLSVDKDRINGDITLIIKDQSGKEIAKRKLTDATDGTGGNTFTVRKDATTGETIYTINGLEIAEDTNVTLNLSGKQKLNGGAYLFRSDVNGKQSQTFIGLVTGDSTRDLNLNVTLGFRVAEPTIEPAARASSRDKHTVTWTASYHTEWPHTPDQPPEEPETPETPETPGTPVAPAVPGYDVPKTGDASGLYYVLAIFSALGLALVTCAGRKRRTA